MVRPRALPSLDATGSLSPNPKSLYILWDEWERGIGGRKPAKEFTLAERGKSKHKYHRRRIIWRLISEMVRSGSTSDAAIDKIYSSYGNNLSVTEIINRIKRDVKAKTLPVNLQV